METLEKTTYRSLRGVENLNASEAATVDVAQKLKDIW